VDTGSRAECGLLYCIVHDPYHDLDVELQLVVTDMWTLSARSRSMGLWAWSSRILYSGNAPTP